MTEEKHDMSEQSTTRNEGTSENSPLGSSEASQSNSSSTRIIAVCSAIVIAGSTLLPWYVFEPTSSAFGSVGIPLPQMSIDRQQNLSIYGGSLGQSGSYAMSFKGAPVLGAGIVGISILCALFAVFGMRWGAFFLAAIPFMIYGAIENKIHYPNAPWTIGIGTYVCAITTVVAFVSCLLVRRQTAGSTFASKPNNT